jgi:hypothetical protein
MALQVDEVLGACYLDPEEFLQRKHVFGVGMAIQTYTRDDLLALLASASRAVDDHCGRSFTDEARTELHAWNERTHRVIPNAPPVTELVSFRLLANEAVAATFAVSDVFYSTQENYLELVSFAMGTTISTPLLQYGLSEVQAEIVYKSAQAVPLGVKRATGIYAAWEANQGFANALVPAQMSGLQVGGTRFNNQRVEVPRAFYDALAEFVRIAIA